MCNYTSYIFCWKIVFFHIFNIFNNIIYNLFRSIPKTTIQYLRSLVNYQFIRKEGYYLMKSHIEEIRLSNLKNRVLITGNLKYSSSLAVSKD